MFGLSSLYTKLILSAGIIAIALGGVLYVRHLQHSNDVLTERNVILKDDNKELVQTIETDKHFNEVRDTLTQLTDEVRRENKETRNKQLKRIDEDVRQGKDKPVGDLLRNFLNGE